MSTLPTLLVGYGTVYLTYKKRRGAHDCMGLLVFGTVSCKYITFLGLYRPHAINLTTAVAMSSAYDEREVPSPGLWGHRDSLQWAVGLQQRRRPWRRLFML